MDLRIAKPAPSPASLRLTGTCSIVLLLISLVSYTIYWSSDYHRQHQVLEEAILDWESHSLEQSFATANFSYAFLGNESAVYGEFSWRKEEEPATLERMEVGDNAYNASFAYAEGDLERVFPRVNEDPLIRFYVHAKPVCMEIRWKSDSQANASDLLHGLSPCEVTEKGISGSILLSYWKHESVPILCTHPMDCVAKCLNHSGNWVGWDRRGSCYRFVVLEHICVRTKPERVSSEEAVWVWDGGCFQGSKVAKYKSVSPIATSNFTALRLELRLPKDPVVVAVSLSSDSLEFADSKSAYRHAAKWTAGGGVLLGLVYYATKRYFQQKEDSYREQIDVMASLPE